MRRPAMRRAILVIVVPALAVAGWGAGALATRMAADRWLAGRQEAGWVAHAGAVAVAGFPLAFETRFADLHLADPETGLAWSAPEFRLEHRLFRLDRIAAVWPGAQTIASPEERIEITATAMSAALDVQPASRFALDAMSAEMAAVALASSAGWTMALEAGSASIRRRAGEAAHYDLEFQAASLHPPEAWRARLDPGRLLPDRVDRARLRADIRLDAPLDMDAIEIARPQITRIEVDEINAVWGDMLFRASGALDVTPEGLPEGTLAVRAENWRAMVALAENAGLLPPRLRPTAEAMLGILAGMSGREEDIDATLRFADGRVFLGPLPLGPAPSLRLR